MKGKEITRKVYVINYIRDEGQESEYCEQLPYIFYCEEDAVEKMNEIIKEDEEEHYFLDRGFYKVDDVEMSFYEM